MRRRRQVDTGKTLAVFTTAEVLNALTSTYPTRTSVLVPGVEYWITGKFSQGILTIDEIVDDDRT